MIYLLHISDLHLAADPQWNNMKNAILKSVRETLRNVPAGEKLLVITGDFHNFVQRNFESAEEFVPSLADAMGIELGKDVFVIPGNHDVSNNIPEEIDREPLLDFIKRNPEKLYQNKRIDKLLSCYKDYEEFIQKTGIYKETGGLNPVASHVRTWRGKLHILHLNTTLAADGSTKTGQMADTLTATSQTIRDELCQGSLPCIAIGHNNFYDLEESQRNELAGMFLQESVSAYLCGDRHQKNHKREEKKIVLGEENGTVTIPNAAAYRASADKGDTYSDFGMTWHLWDEQTGKVQMKYMRWDPDDQGGLQPDGEESYSLRTGSGAGNDKGNAPGSGENSLYGSASCWLSDDTLSAWGREPVKSSYVKNFLLGGRCRWEVIFQDDLIVERDIVDDLCQKTLDGGIYVLLGPGGEGKTTALMQMCVKLIGKGMKVFYYRGYGLSELPGNIPANSVFVLDSPPERPVFKRFLEKAVEEGVTLIIGSRENEWNLLKQSLQIPGRDIQEVRMPKLRAKEAWGFADCVCRNLKPSKERQEIKDIFLTNSYGFLYAAMLLAVNNAESLEEIAHQIIENLSCRSHQGMLLLAHIVLAEKCGVKFTRENFRKVCEKLAMSPREGNKALSREILLNGDTYQTRHEVISNLFYSELFADSGILSQSETDDILTFLMQLQFRQYSMTYGFLRNRAVQEIIQLCKGLSLASLETCRYLADRVLDEIKTEPWKTYNKLFTSIEDEEVQLMFFRQCFDRRWLLPVYLKIWCDLLQKKGAPWDVTEEYSPAWIMRKSCLEKGGDSSAWLMWAQMEESENGAGEYNRENTARWVYREACLNRGTDSNTWLAWAKLEESETGAGGYDRENTARWICREACVNRGADGNVWLAWAKLEESETGAGGYDRENTARWICREACLNRGADSSTWLAWAKLEESETGAGEYDRENMARWIYREACLNRWSDSITWLAWAKLEESETGAGDYDRENTARWIYREACLNCGADGSTWLAWGKMEERENNIGAWDLENSARWIYRQACIEHGGKGGVWETWGELEERKKNIGDSDQENSLRWIIQKGIEHCPNCAPLYVTFASMELSNQAPGRAREILRLGGNYTLDRLAILELYYGNIDTDSEYCTKKLMAKMELEKEKSFGELHSLCYCSRLLGMEEDAERYDKQLHSHPDFDPDYTIIEDYIHLCQRAMQKDSARIFQ